jgi:hypothetical protein
MLLVLAALISIVAPRPSRVTRSAFERIEKGMTRVEVEKILGGPPGDYTTQPYSRIYIQGILPTDEWIGDGIQICLWLSWDGEVGEYVVRVKHLYEIEPWEMGIVNRALWHLDRWWARMFGKGL